MRIIQKEIKTKDYYKKHLEIVNCLIPANLTEKEIEILAAFMSLDKKLIEEDVFNTLTRKKVREQLNLSPGGLSNHLNSMINKNILAKNKITNRIKINKILIPEEKAQGYQIKIIRINETT